MDANNVQTPEFLCWAIERQCPLREMLPDNQPEKVERQLRAPRFTAEAMAEGRIENDLAVSADRTMAFRVSESLAIFGGETAVRECCGSCPANSLAAIRQPSYAGCYGLFPLPDPRDQFFQRTQKCPRANQLFTPTQFLWYGWWVRSPLDAEQIAYLAPQFAAISKEPEFADHRPLHELALALHACQRQGLALSVQLFPRGEIDGVWWKQAPHCAVCRADWLPGTKRCEMCGQTRFPASPKKRRVRGSRPYRAI